VPGLNPDGTFTYAYYDPKVIERFEQQGTPVHVTETSTASVEVRMIPAQ
jgi:hypothetical protein